METKEKVSCDSGEGKVREIMASTTPSASNKQSRWRLRGVWGGDERKMDGKPLGKKLGKRGDTYRLDS